MINTLLQTEMVVCDVEDCETGMGAGMALAVASRSGLLAAMAKDDSPKTAKEWAEITRSTNIRINQIMRSLVALKVVVASDEEDPSHGGGNLVASAEEASSQGGVVPFSSPSPAGAQRFLIPGENAAAVKEIGGVFEALLMHPRCEATMNLVLFRWEKARRSFV